MSETKTPYNPVAIGDISLRDWFAGQALAGICAYPGPCTDTEKFVISAYRLADAMLRERSR